jgi:hypothetical protein
MYKGAGVWGSRDVCLLGGWCLCCGWQERSFQRRYEARGEGSYRRCRERHVKERKTPRAGDRARCWAMGELCSGSDVQGMTFAPARSSKHQIGSGVALNFWT